MGETSILTSEIFLTGVNGCEFDYYYNFSDFVDFCQTLITLGHLVFIG
jgi:hypothetical protein